MDCQNDEELCDWLGRGCDEATGRAVESHLDRCDACHSLVAAIVKLDVPASDRSVSATVLPRGGSLGRYRIVDVLGAGAMGVVYAAHDDTLDRTVALKLLRSGLGNSPEAATRLAREARAMARVSHPNVVTVHEIGIHDGMPFVAMERVDGMTLSDWLSERKPKLDEILRVFMDAANGLAAVHRAGLVHRDFKPTNVLVSGDGRVRIADFGLVHLVGGDLPGRLDGREIATSRVTATGAAVGTPAYVAPEQLDGRADARSDQFSFCVALFEACFGQRPFQGAKFDELDAAMRGTLRPPKALPRSARWVLPILRRGLAYDPADRFPHMEALAAALSRSPARQRRLALGASSTLAAIVALLFGVSATRGPTCATVDRALAGIWDEPRRQAIRSAFLSRQGQHASQAWEKIANALDAYAAEWVGQRRATCSDARADNGSHALVAARVGCLDRRLTDLRLVSDLLIRSDLDSTDNATQVLAELRSPASCEREGTAVTDLSPNEQALLEGFTQVRLLFVVGRHKQALELAGKLLPASESARPGIHAKALLRSGQLELTRSLDAAVHQLRQAVLQAETAHDDETRAEALTYLAFAMSQLTSPSDLALGEQYVDEAAAVLARLGGDRRLDPLVLIYRAVLLRARERYDEAVGQLELVVGTLEREPARDWDPYERALTALGITLIEMGRPDDALRHFKKALALVEGAMGHRSPALFASVLNVGEALVRSGRADEALPYLERAIELAEVGDGPNSRSSAAAFLALASCRAQQGNAVAARPLLERALTLSNSLASADRLRFDVRLALGEHLARYGESARGQALLEEALRQGVRGEESTAQARFALAQALPRAELRRARELAEQARATYASAGGRRSKELAAIDRWLRRNELGGGRRGKRSAPT